MNMFIALLLAATPQTHPKPLIIGTHYTDSLVGLAVYQDAKHSLLLDFEWATVGGQFKRGYKALVDATVHFVEAAPDDTYHRIAWTVGTSTITYEWGLSGNAGAVGRLSSTGTIDIIPSFSPAWPRKIPDTASRDFATDHQVGGYTVIFKP